MDYNSTFFLQRGEYVLAHIDLHWNSSEHQVEGELYQVEAQLHHFDLRYDTYQQALEHGATVSLALLLQV